MDTRGKCRPLFKFIFSQRPFLAALDIPKLLSKAAVPVFILVKGVCTRPHVTASRGRRRAAPRGVGRWAGPGRPGPLQPSRRASPFPGGPDTTASKVSPRLHLQGGRDRTSGSPGPRLAQSPLPPRSLRRLLEGGL